jgi:hypothetical protein
MSLNRFPAVNVCVGRVSDCRLRGCREAFGGCLQGGESLAVREFTAESEGPNEGDRPKEAPGAGIKGTKERGSAPSCDLV